MGPDRLTLIVSDRLTLMPRCRRLAGAWSLADAPQLSWSEGDNWHVTVDLPSGAHQHTSSTPVPPDPHRVPSQQGDTTPAERGSVPCHCPLISSLNPEAAVRPSLTSPLTLVSTLTCRFSGGIQVRGAGCEQWCGRGLANRQQLGAGRAARGGRRPGVRQLVRDGRHAEKEAVPTRLILGLWRHTAGSMVLKLALHYSRVGSRLGG